MTRKDRIMMTNCRLTDWFALIRGLPHSVRNYGLREEVLVEIEHTFRNGRKSLIRSSININCDLRTLIEFAEYAWDKTFFEIVARILQTVAECYTPCSKEDIDLSGTFRFIRPLLAFENVLPVCLTLTRAIELMTVRYRINFSCNPSNKNSRNRNLQKNIWGTTHVSLPNGFRASQTLDELIDQFPYYINPKRRKYIINLQIAIAWISVFDKCSKYLYNIRAFITWLAIVCLRANELGGYGFGRVVNVNALVIENINVTMNSADVKCMESISKQSIHSTDFKGIFKTNVDEFKRDSSKKTFSIEENMDKSQRSYSVNSFNNITAPNEKLQFASQEIAEKPFEILSESSTIILPSLFEDSQDVQRRTCIDTSTEYDQLPFLYRENLDKASETSGTRPTEILPYRTSEDCDIESLDKELLTEEDTAEAKRTRKNSILHTKEEIPPKSLKLSLQTNIADQKMALYYSQLPIIHSEENEMEKNKKISYFLNRLKNTQQDFPKVKNIPEFPLVDEETDHIVEETLEDSNGTQTLNNNDVSNCEAQKRERGILRDVTLHEGPKFDVDSNSFFPEMPGNLKVWSILKTIYQSFNDAILKIAYYGQVADDLLFNMYGCLYFTDIAFDIEVVSVVFGGLSRRKEDKDNSTGTVNKELEKVTLISDGN
ncbi:hypothetical protein GQR58_016714 [Nymphon striatum]|nr:hypothetical protein GQR58_016714 [Nymphon striatum]